MKIAYFITAYKDETQLIRLIEALMDGDADFYIHIDKKIQDKTFKKKVEKISIQGNSIVRFVPDSQRVKVYWGGYSQVNAQLSIINEMLKSQRIYDWCINLTGMDYPVWSNRKIKDFLNARNGQPIIKGYQIDRMYGTEQEERLKDRIRKYWFFDIYPVIVRKIVNKTAMGIQMLFKVNRKHDLDHMPWKFCYGSEYWALPSRMVVQVYNEYVHDMELQKILKTVFVPSEFWVQTILMSKAILTEEEKNEMCFSGNRYNGLGAVALLHYFVYKGGIKVLGIEDYENIEKSGKMFIRKAKTGVSEELLDQIDQIRNGDD